MNGMLKQMPNKLCAPTGQLNLLNLLQSCRQLRGGTRSSLPCFSNKARIIISAIIFLEKNCEHPSSSLNYNNQNFSHIDPIFRILFVKKNSFHFMPESIRTEIPWKSVSAL